MVELESNSKVSARKLHKWLGSKRKFVDWWDFKTEQAELKEVNHYSVGHKFVTSYNRAYEDYHLTEDAAMDLALIEGTKRGKQVRDSLKSVFDKTKKGEFVSHKTVLALLKLTKIIGFISVQEKFEKEHFAYFNDKYKWHSYRNDLLGMNKMYLEEALLIVGKKYRNKRQALMSLDKYELVRHAVVDLLMSLGKTEAYALSIGKLAKEMAIEQKISIYDDRKATIDFRNWEQKEFMNKKDYLLGM